MSYEYSEITDPTYLATRQERNEPDYVLVRPTDCSQVPIRDPNWKSKPTVLTSVFKNIDSALKKFQVLPDDVWVASYPKSGTTWCQEMVWLICNDLDYQRAADVNLVERFPSMKLSGLFSRPDDHRPFKEVLEMPRPRFIKTHLHVGLLPEAIWTVKPKIVYVHRNPKSVAVSFYHHSASFTGYKGTLEDFTRSFMRDLQLYSPYHEHVIEYSQLSHLDNVLVLKYEDMKQDLLPVLRRVCTFFNKRFSDEQLATLSKHLSFESMKDNPAVNFSRMVNPRTGLKVPSMDALPENQRFMRKGKATSYKEELSLELQTEIDEWTRNKIKFSEHLKLFV
ncbi:luciferin sulfotransferase-like [Culex pipiens pallens]|uniref:luciferin sulfotransferase-like n=1 Tax=Culex pipiens pallens TaxID=42434 RepID=UPI001954595E|nr:luciferin sulfotransferase-like [Culex pipiens pallens]